MKKKIGLVLGGGGAKGAYQIGVLKALDEAKILKRVRVTSGTSIGAINSFFLMHDLSIEEIIKVWKEFNNDAIYGKNKYKETRNVSGLYNIKGILEKITPFMNEKAYRQTKIEGFVTLAKVPTKGIFAKLNMKNYEKEVVFLNESDDPLKAVLASAAIPLVFGEKEIDGVRYVDGGLVDNFPFTPALIANANIIISVGLHPKLIPSRPLPGRLHIDFTPLKELGPFPKVSLDFSPEKTAKYFALGYKNAKNLIAYLKKEKYFWFGGRLKLKKGRLVTLESLKTQK
ncbi:MAG: hypothetical protein BWY30_01037 [Tenericutes bacterium ADurb.Bin239]|nr:MAG: hypothetical protein BWY30_01037 [Tenericutes bacterium ADurb.Bin239]